MEFTDKPIVPFGKTLLQMAVPTQLSFKTPLVFRVVKELKEAQCLPWTGSHRAELCFDEAVTNCMTHGNQLDPSKKVKVSVFCDDKNWGAVFSDEGPGFTPDALPDPNADDFLFKETGRGFMLMESYLDRLVYSPAENKLLMVRHRQTEPDETEAEAAVALADETAEAATEGPVSVAVAEDLTEMNVLSSRIDGDNIAEIKAALMSDVQRGMKICLDMSRVEYVSSVGLGTLVSFYKQVRAAGGDLVVAGLQPAVRDILESAHLLKLFKTAADRNAAISELKKH